MLFYFLCVGSNPISRTFYFFRFCLSHSSNPAKHRHISPKFDYKKGLAKIPQTLSVADQIDIISQWFCFCGADGGGRTHTVSLPRDFESRTGGFILFYSVPVLTSCSLQFRELKSHLRQPPDISYRIFFDKLLETC